MVRTSPAFVSKDVLDSTEVVASSHDGWGRGETAEDEAGQSMQACECSADSRQIENETGQTMDRKTVRSVDETLASWIKLD